MALKHFRTSKRLWFYISLVLFVIPWFIPWFGHDLYISCPAVLWIAVFARLDSFGETIGALQFLVLFTLSFGVPAVSIGWVLQCIIVMVRDMRKRKTPNAA